MERSNAVHLGAEKNPFFLQKGKTFSFYSCKRGGKQYCFTRTNEGKNKSLLTRMKGEKQTSCDSYKKKKKEQQPFMRKPLNDKRKCNNDLRRNK